MKFFSSKPMKFLLALLLLYVLIVVLAFLFQDKMVYLPTKLDKSHRFSFDMGFEEIYLGPDGNKIHGLFFPLSSPSKGLILYFHGNADDLQRWGNYAVDFTSLGYEVMMIDYPGYGKSESKPSEEGFYQSAEWAYAWAEERYSADQIIIYGRSIGCGPATYLATKEDARMMILETPFYSMPDVVSRRYPAIFPFSVKNRFPNHVYLANRKTEDVFIFQGTEDEIVPYASALKLKPLLNAEGHFITIEGGKHKNLSEFSDFHTALKKILDGEEL